MLVELLKDGYGKAMDLNCAEKILYGANWAYDLKLSPESLKLAAGFGGGMGVGGVCGTVSGAIMVLSHLYVTRNSHQNVRIKELEKEFITKFNNFYTCTDCTTLKEKYVDDDEIGCHYIILKAAEILDEIVEREGFEEE